MRLMCMLALIAAGIFGALTMVRSTPIRTTSADGTVSSVYPPRDDTGLTLTFGFLIAAFAPKAVQKFAEQRLRNYTGLAPTTTGPVVALPDVAASASTTLSSIAADPRLEALQREIAALRERLSAAAATQPLPTSNNGTALAVPGVSPLQQIRQGGTL